MDDITTKLEKIDINNKSKKTLYYSVSIDYIEVINILNKILSLDDYNKYFFGIKTETGYDIDDKPYSETFEKIKEDASIDSKYLAFIDKMKTGEKFIIYDNTFYIANSEFHITTLFTGGKPHEKSEFVEKEVGSNVLIKINKLGISNNFITLGVETIKLEDGNEIQYFGNDVKHITIGLNKTGKKVFPKDSYTALTDGKIFDVDFTLEGLTNRVYQ